MKIFLAEADKKLRVGLQFLINQEPGFQVIGIAVNGNGLPSQLQASQPDVLLLDWRLPGVPINELVADIRALEMPLKIVAVSIRPEDESEARAANVDVFVTKANSPDKLLAELKTMSRNN